MSETREYPRTVFDKPQATLLPDSKGARMYANVSNTLEVTQGSYSWAVAVAVPSMLFTFFKDVARVTPEQQVTLSLDLEGTYFLFSAMVMGEGRTDLIDLWAYPAKAAPAWILDPDYAI